MTTTMKVKRILALTLVAGLAGTAPIFSHPRAARAATAQGQGEAQHEKPAKPEKSMPAQSQGEEHRLEPQRPAQPEKQAKQQEKLEKQQAKQQENRLPSNKNNKPIRRNNNRN